MTGFSQLLEYRAPPAVDAILPSSYQSDGSETMTHILQSRVCDCITLYMDKYEEEFGPFVPKFVDNCWKLLTQLGLGEETDKVCRCNEIL